MAERTSSPSRAKTTERGSIGSTTAAAARSGGAETGAGTESRAPENESLADRVRERASAQLNTQKERATEGLGTMAQAVRQSTQQLREQHHETVASYIDQAADQIDRFSRGLKNKDVGELLDDAQRLARRRPALFVGSAFAVGLAGARFFKSSPPHEERGYAGGREGGGAYPSYGAEGTSGRGMPSSVTGSGTGSTATRTTGTTPSSSLSPDYPGTER